MKEFDHLEQLHNYSDAGNGGVENGRARTIAVALGAIGVGPGTDPFAGQKVIAEKVLQDPRVAGMESE